MRLSALIITEWRMAWRDMHAIGVLFIMPAIFLLLMAFAMSGILRAEIPALELQVEVPQITTDSEFFIAALQAQLPTSKLQTQPSQDGKIKLAADFAERLLDSPHQGPELAFAATSDNLQRSHIRNAVTLALAQTRMAAFLLDSQLLDESLPLAQQLQQVQLQTQSEFIEQQILSSGNLVANANAGQLSVPAWLIFGMFFIVLPMSSRLQQEFQSGVLLRLRVIQIAPALLLAGKLVPYAIINLIQFASLLLLGKLALPWLGLPALELHGSASAYILLALAITLASCSFGLLISAIARNAEQSLLLSAGSNLILAAIGGIMVPKSMMPPAMQQLANLSPMSWSLDGFLTLLVGHGNSSDILLNCLALGVFALGCAIVGTLLLHYRLKNTLWTTHN